MRRKEEGVCLLSGVASVRAGEVTSCAEWAGGCTDRDKGLWR